MDRRVERGNATREAVIAAARDLFARLGYEGTSIEAVLAAAGIARGALYHHFATKAELFDAVLDRETAALAEAAAAAARAVADPLDSLRAGCEAYLECSLDHGVQRITLIDPPAVVGWERWREIDRRHILAGLRASIRRLMSAGTPPDEIDVLAHIVLASVGEVAMFVASAPKPAAAVFTARGAIHTLLTRLFARTKRPATNRTRRSR